MTVRVLIAAGGTGGHVFPALAIAEEVRRRGGEVQWLGAGGMEMDVVPAHGFILHAVPFSPPRGISGMLRLAVAAMRALILLRRLRPSVVLGMGGYAAAPGGLAAKLAGIPLIVHEQNAVAGRANKLLHKIAHRTLTGFPDTFSGGEWAGNPVREEFCNLPPPATRFADAKDKPHRLLVLGGSQGAQALNSQVPAALALLPEQFSVIHQCGRGNLETTRREYESAGRAAEVRDFMDDVAAQMADADLVICRAGAATLAELAAVGAAALLIPYPHAAGGHQNANAEFFAGQGAAFLRRQAEFGAKWLADFLSSTTRPMLQAAAEKARQLTRPQAAAEVAAACFAEAGHAA